MPETKHLGIFDHLSDSKQKEKLLERGVVDHLKDIPSHLVDKLHNCNHKWSQTGSVYSGKVCTFCGVSVNMYTNWLRHLDWLDDNKNTTTVFIGLHARLSIVNGEHEEMESRMKDIAVQKYKRAYTPERWAQWCNDCGDIGIFTVDKFPPLEPSDFHCEYGHTLDEKWITDVDNKEG